MTPTEDRAIIEGRKEGRPVGILAKLRGRRETKRPEERRFPYDPEKHVAVIRSSICTGEKAAGFKDRESGRFKEVMLIRGPGDEARFRELYGLEAVKKEY